MIATPEFSKLSWKERIQLLAMMAFVATLTFARELNQAFLIIFLVSCIPLWSKAKWNSQWKNIAILSSTFLISIATSFYPDNFAPALKVLEIQLAMILVPLLLCCSYEPAPFKNKAIFIAFSASISVALIYLLAFFVYKMISESIPLSGWFQEQYLNHHFSAPIDMHATFLSAYASIALYYIIISFTQTRSSLTKGLLLLLIMVFFIALFMLAARMVLALTCLCLILFIPYEIAKRKWFNRLLLGGVIVALLGYFFTSSNYLESRFTSHVDKDVKLSLLIDFIRHPDSATQHDLMKNDGARIERWVAGCQLVKENPVFGYGTGSEKRVLFQRYEKLGLTVSLGQGYDAHNQFLAFALKSGIFGLAAFLLTMIFSFYHAFRSRNFLYVTFLVVATGICLIDNLLEGNKGVFYFAFFNTLFFLNTQSPLLTGKRAR